MQYATVEELVIQAVGREIMTGEDAGRKTNCIIPSGEPRGTTVQQSHKTA